MSNFKGKQYNKPKAMPQQIGIDEQIFKPRNTSKPIDIVFMGNTYGNQFPLSGFRKHLVNSLKARYGSRFRLYGTGWPNADGNLNGNQHEESKVYNKSKIAISCSHFDVERYTSDRLLRIIASNVCPLVHHYNGLEVDFEAGKEMATFKSVNDCINQIDYLLERDEKRELIRKNALEKSKRFTYKTMVEQIINM